MSGDVGAEVAAVAEWLAKALYRSDVNLPMADPLDISCRDVADALAPLIAERVEAAKAEAWDEGALRIADLLGCGFDNDHLTRLNPHRAEATP